MSIHPSEEQVARVILNHSGPLGVHYADVAIACARAVMALYGPQPTVAQVKAEALREAADAEECGCPGDWNGTVCDTCQGFARRLRARAARIEKEQA